MIFIDIPSYNMIGYKIYISSRGQQHWTIYIHIQAPIYYMLYLFS